MHYLHGQTKSFYASPKYRTPFIRKSLGLCPSIGADGTAVRPGGLMVIAPICETINNMLPFCKSGLYMHRA